MGALGWSVPAAHAAGSTIQALIAGEALVLTGPGSTSPYTASTVPVVVTGTVYGLSQIQVYVDGQQVDTVPLSQSDTSFSYNLHTDPGTHAVKLVGISQSGTDPSVSFVLIYSPVDVSPGSSWQAPSVNLPQSGVVITRDIPASPQGIDSVSGVRWFIDTLYGGMVFLDIVNPGHPENTPTMLGRFFIVLVGAFMVIFARLVLVAYRKVRYGWLGWRKRPLPGYMRRHPLLWIRLAGVFVAGFVLFAL